MDALKNLQELSNEEVIDLLEEYNLLDDLIDILIENHDYCSNDDLSRHERAVEIGKDLLCDLIENQ